MKILMFSNTYLPHVSGVARSVEAFAHAYRRRGHEVLIVAPHFDNEPAEEQGVIRVPAIQHFNGSDFSVRLPIPGYLHSALEQFRPDIVHSHHPFLLGDTALRTAAEYDVPLVFQHHTMYERYTHYVPGDSPALRRFVVDMSTEYANLCDQVFAPSESIAAVLRDRGVKTPIAVVPTGVDVAHFAHGDGTRLRRKLGIPVDFFVVGYVGRLAPEKSLAFLADAVTRFLRHAPRACFLVVGDGPSRAEVQRVFDRRRLSDRLYLAGTREGQDLVDAYHAMDVFGFASQTETQGMVLTEAMSAGCPVVGIDAPGVREVVDDRQNGRLLPGRHAKRFAASLAWVADRSEPEREALREKARATAQRFSMSAVVATALESYQSMVECRSRLGETDWEASWRSALRRVETEWKLLSTRARAAGKAVFRRSFVGSCLLRLRGIARSR